MYLCEGFAKNCIQAKSQVNIKPNIKCPQTQNPEVPVKSPVQDHKGLEQYCSRNPIRYGNQHIQEAFPNQTSNSR